MHRNPDLLWEMFPDLDKNIELPVNATEVLHE